MTGLILEEDPSGFSDSTSASLFGVSALAACAGFPATPAPPRRAERGADQTSWMSRCSASSAVLITPVFAW